MSKTPGRQDNGLTYRSAGVDIDVGNALVEAIKPLARSTARPGADAALGGFGGLFDLKAAGYDDPLLVAANDGVGTKLKLAVETGHHVGVGIDLVAMCVNDLVVQGAEPLFFLDYVASGKLDLPVLEAVIAGIAQGCRMAGAALIGGETAEMPGMYTAGDYDLAGFAVGAVERHRLLPRSDIAAGAVILGLASSGVHSNGFSLVRRIVTQVRADLAAPPPFIDPAPRLGLALLTPTRIYVKPLLHTIRCTEAVLALAHITGGGLTENIPRVIPAGLAAEIELGNWPVPEVFGWLAASGGVAEAEMLRTFNCGIGMVVVTAEETAEAVVTCLQLAGERVTRIGRLVERGDGEPVRYVGRLGLGR